MPVAEGVSVERNCAFLRCVQECVELVELLGMPVLKAKGEAEALCAQLNGEGYVDACITADGDAFLFGAKCVIKHFRANSKEPFECYNMSDIKAGLGLKRKHLIAISLLVGNDHDVKGVQGIGLDSALRFVQAFSEDDILNRLHEIGSGNALKYPISIKPVENFDGMDGNSPKTKQPHCSFCGHPDSKRDHMKFSCQYCGTNIDEGCTSKPQGFKCDCFSCDTICPLCQFSHFMICLNFVGWSSLLCLLILLVFFIV